MEDANTDILTIPLGIAFKIMNAQTKEKGELEDDYKFVFGDCEITIHVKRNEGEES